MRIGLRIRRQHLQWISLQFHRQNLEQLETSTVVRLACGARDRNRRAQTSRACPEKRADRSIQLLELVGEAERFGNRARGVSDLVDGSTDIATDESIKPFLDGGGAEGSLLRGIATAGGEILEQRTRLTRDESIPAESWDADIGIEGARTFPDSKPYAG